MRILYAIQGTGNGHLARATEIVPILKSLGDTDVLVSGTQSDLKVSFSIDYQYRGMSFIIGDTGGVDILKTFCKLSFRQFIKDIRQLPVEKYDLVISDFEPVSAWACKLKKKECIGLSHQNAVLHPMAPLPESNDWFGKLVLQHYAPMSVKYGFNFRDCSPFIFPPVIRSAIRNAETSIRSHYTVYLPAYSDQQIYEVLSQIPEIQWQVFSKHSGLRYQIGNVKFEPVSLERFTQSFLSCTGIICTAGFEGPAEAIYMGKKLCVIPMKKQYEQYCNAAFLKSMGIKVLDNFADSVPELTNWIQTASALRVKYPDLTREMLVNLLIQHGQKNPEISVSMA